jgi:hypothetical protein
VPESRNLGCVVEACVLSGDRERGEAGFGSVSHADRHHSKPVPITYVPAS